MASEAAVSMKPAMTAEMSRLTAVKSAVAISVRIMSPVVTSAEHVIIRLRRPDIDGATIIVAIVHVSGATGKDNHKRGDECQKTGSRKPSPCLHDPK